jgi:hypothetical protein
VCQGTLFSHGFPVPKNTLKGLKNSLQKDDIQMILNVAKNHWFYALVHPLNNFTHTNFNLQTHIPHAQQ